MHAVFTLLGIAVLGFGLLDVFLTALNYDECGFLVMRLCALQWRCLRGITRRLPRRWRPLALRQVIGLNLLLGMAIWLGSVAAGYGLIYYGQMVGVNFDYDGRGLGPGLFSAMYFSAAQLSTVGTSQISPETNLLRALSILETLSGVGLVTLILTFLFGVYQVVRDLRALSSNLVSAAPDGDDPLAGLAPYFLNGDPVCLDNHLLAISQSFWSYADGLRQHPLAYYFQSGRDQFSLPYALLMLGQWIGALRWGLPSIHPASLRPLLAQLGSQFEQFADYLHGRIGWPDAQPPQAVSPEGFAAACRTGGDPSDLWLHRFLCLNREMARLVRLDPMPDPTEAYARYRQWLPFAHRAEQMTKAVRWDLDYQPDDHDHPARFHRHGIE